MSVTVSCECGACHKCKSREAARARREAARQAAGARPCADDCGTLVDPFNGRRYCQACAKLRLRTTGRATYRRAKPKDERPCRSCMQTSDRRSGSNYCTPCVESGRRYRDRGIRSRHRGYSLMQFDADLARQGGHCAACPDTDPGNPKGWHVDHDHSCCPAGQSCPKCRRGVLCHGCNIAAGGLKDDPARALSLGIYLERRAA